MNDTVEDENKGTLGTLVDDESRMKNAGQQGDTQIERLKPGQYLPVAAATPTDLLAIAVQQDADIDKLEKLMELQERWEANEARKAYHAAVAKFKKNPPVVVKGTANTQYDSMYASLDDLVSTVNPALSKHGLECHWEFNQFEGSISVTCILSHILGHSERVTLAGPPDVSGAKNPIQQIKSTTTYLKGATYEAITGISTSDKQGVNVSDDGNSAQAYITDEQAKEIKDILAKHSFDTKALMKSVGSEGVAVDQMPKAKYKSAMAKINSKIKKATDGN